MANRANLTRRGFLKAAAATVAFPHVVTTSALGATGRLPASERLVMGVIGAGGQGARHIGGGIWVQGSGFLSKPGVQIVAVSDVNRNRLNNAKNIIDKFYGNSDCATYREFEELLGRSDIDVILCATGDRWHTPVSIAAAKAGKDIYCEKPISLTVYEARALARAMRRYGRIFQTGTQQRSWYEFRFACELVRNGYIGDIRRIKVNVGGPPEECNLPAEGAAPEWLDYDRWLGQVPWHPFHPEILGWMRWKDFSGGEMTNWGTHMFDVAQWALGMDASGPVEIIPPDGKEFQTLTYRYANGTVMTREGISQPTPGVRFEGTEGVVEVTREQLITEPDSLRRQSLASGDVHLYESKEHPDNFLACVRTRTRPASDADVGYRSITVCHLGNIAYWLQRPLRWDPMAERFTDDPQADRLLARAMRSPWQI
ncbi:MAG: Gfo/Idh/MocA family oxidoreductase [Sedimentisphaerales bacterium]|nr:Gfo/Idh/MocA family oxidoreductase [Sedimentisphaerales bacterium]